MKRNYLLLVFLCFSYLSFGQYYDDSIKKTDLSKIQNALNKETKNGFTQADLGSWIVKSNASSRNANSWYYYLVQTHNDIEVNQTIANVQVSENKVVVNNSRFIKNLHNKINAEAPSISAEQAVQKALDYQGLYASFDSKVLSFDKVKQVYTFAKTDDLQSDIKVNLVYEKKSETEVVLTWNVILDFKNGQHWFNTRIDAVSGEFVNQNDWVTSCNWSGNESHENHNHSLKENKQIDFIKSVYKNSNESTMMAGSYRVIPYYVESPNHGDFELVTNPDNATASPNGWHTGTETEGNNGVARDDQNGDNGFGPTTSQSGAGLVFDYPYGGPGVAASTYIDAAATQLFYMSNVVHDIYYLYGFDEASGNFQESNFSGSGSGGDGVNLDVQDGSGVNNANFSTPPEGGNPRMQMFLWNQGAYDPNAVSLLVVNNTFLAGDYDALDNNFTDGSVPVTAPITSDLVLVIDDNSVGNADGSTASTDVSDGCGAITNGAAINGKIAILRRGTCTFVSKVLEAQSQGAIAVLIINNVAGDIVLGGGDAGVTIPAYSLNKVEGDAIIAEMSNSTVNVTFNVPTPTPTFVNIDGDFDNGVIAHEYGHGINQRLVAGPGNTSCVNQNESPGEGWGDYIGKILLLKNVDNGIAVNGTGTFVVGQSPSGQGIRPAPYSGDIANNPMTYQSLIDDTTNATYTIPHGVGSVWAGMLWDLTWDLIAVHGFTDDIYDANGGFGNTIALNLVVEGMKLTPCNPGFVDARNAILQADDVLYGNGVAGSETGANQCIIWSAFARRGLGASANQGTVFRTFDGASAFDLPTSITCTPDYLIDNGEDVIQNICQGSGQTIYDFVFYEQNGYDTDTAFTATGLPAGATASFAPATMRDTGIFQLIVTGIPAGTSGSFPITVTPGGDASKSKQVNLVINPTNPDLTDGDTDFSVDGTNFTPFSNNGTVTVGTGIDLTLRLPATAFNGTILWTGPDNTTYTTNSVNFTNITDNDAAIEGAWTAQASFTNDCGSSLAPQMINFTVVIDPLLSTDDFNLNNVVLYPNPTKSTISIKGMKSVQDLKVSILDITGRVLVNQVNISKSNNEVKIDMNQLSSGTYFITLDSDNFNVVKKVIKE